MNRENPVTKATEIQREEPPLELLNEADKSKTIEVVKFVLGGSRSHTLRTRQSEMIGGDDGEDPPNKGKE